MTKAEKPMAVVELDEMHSLCRSKKYCWAWIAVNRYGRRVVDFVCGRHNTLTFNKIWNRMCEMEVGVFCSDGWKSYAQTIPRRKHNATKKCIHSRRLQQPDQALFGEVQAEDKVLFKPPAHDGNIPEITISEMRQLAEKRYLFNNTKILNSRKTHRTLLVNRAFVVRSLFCTLAKKLRRTSGKFPLPFYRLVLIGNLGVQLAF